MYYLIPILVIPFIVGLLDDFIQLKPIAKVFAQLLTATAVFFLLNIRIDTLYELVNLNIPIAVSYLLTVGFIIVLTNSFNLIDGIDGLAGVFSSVTFACLGVWFFFISEYVFALLCFALFGSIIAFLFQNWEPSKIFMGDTGSLVIGTMLSIVVIHFMNTNAQLRVSSLKFNSSIGAAFCLLAIPIIDTVRVISIRVYKRISPFKADKRHIHHALVRMGLTHRQAVSIITLAHLSFITIAIVLRKQHPWIQAGVPLLWALSLSLVLERYLIKFTGK